ncbi:MAG: hypothetical protein ABFD04_11640 [Syntrophomonas sp.]
MGQAKALVKARTQAVLKKQPWTMHDQDYMRVFKAIEKARGRMVPGQVCEEFRCPICGGPAFVFRREKNMGRDYVGGCEKKCFDCWE